MRSGSTSGPRGPRWWAWLVGALPALAFLATFGLFFVDKNREARTVLQSGRGMLTVAAIVVGYVALAVLVRRLARRAWVAPLVLTAVILGLAAWVVRPYYVDDTADRRLVAGPVGQGAMGPPGAAEGGAPAPAQSPPLPQRVSTGRLRGLGHEASGSVSVIRNPDGSLVVRFESFDIEGTPDPQVHLVEGSNKRNPDGVTLGPLHGDRGQVLDYPVPAGPAAGPGWTVLVWCRAFSVPIANASQTAA
jgi:hypothetical protein